MLVECGAGTTEVVVISLGGVCVSRTVRVGGASLDQAITDFLHLRHKFLIGEQSAERLKLELADESVTGSGADCDMQVRGRCIEAGLPTVLTLPRQAFRTEEHTSELPSL